ncbi:hypothetical protein G7Z17_g2167 [Cylindrodendrum hubeiense]|uniref:C2H2-type domain-containing protein n=1 Tax=Cylindrodendrum hubeiense TaxID=595255 RepID=A0A9P5LJE3_9HYPO|nr:hypothetical protein G7Z17_g2167 [Cylindrodendrum hubeiense]
MSPGLPYASNVPQLAVQGSRRRHGAQHTCTYCSRSFARAEHLHRHRRIHTREKPYTCDCGVAFTRRDLLTRHWRLAQHGPNGRVESSPPRDFNALDVDVVLNRVDRCPLPDDVIVPSQAISQQHPQILQDDTEFDLVTGRDNFRDFENFIDGVGLPVDWAPYYEFEWQHHGDQHHSDEAIPQHGDESIPPHGEDLNAISSPEEHDTDSPFSTWLPSAVDGDQALERISENGKSSRSSGSQPKP